MIASAMKADRRQSGGGGGDGAGEQSALAAEYRTLSVTRNWWGRGGGEGTEQRFDFRKSTEWSSSADVPVQHHLINLLLLMPDDDEDDGDDQVYTFGDRVQEGKERERERERERAREREQEADD